jgi:hypothetical protein
VSGSPSKSVFVGSGNSDKSAKNWCLETATFRIVVGSMWGSADLLVNGKAVASYSCTNPPNPCGDDTKAINGSPRFAKQGATISWRPTSCIDSTGASCPNDQFKVTIEVGYEPAKQE